MKLYIIQGVGEINFFEKTELEELCKKISINNKTESSFGLRGKLTKLTNQEFAELLPLLNGYFGKYYFVDFGLSLIDENTMLGNNINDLKYKEEKIKQIQEQILRINDELKSEKLITNSKKEKYLETIQESIFFVVCFLVKTYFLIVDGLQNKKELQDIISDQKTLEEFRSNAYLINQVSGEKLEILIIRFKYLTEQLQTFSDIMSKYFNNYVKKNDSKKTRTE